MEFCKRFVRWVHKLQLKDLVAFTTLVQTLIVIVRMLTGHG
jgi:hypothetical protein